MNVFPTFHTPRARALAAALTVALACTAGALQAAPSSDDRSLERGAVPDVTPQQRYNSAIREAGGALKESMRECLQLAAPARAACVREARATYAYDMAEARKLLQR